MQYAKLCSVCTPLMATHSAMHVFIHKYVLSQYRTIPLTNTNLQFVTNQTMFIVFGLSFLI